MNGRPCRGCGETRPLIEFDGRGLTCLICKTQGRCTQCGLVFEITTLGKGRRCSSCLTSYNRNWKMFNLYGISREEYEMFWQSQEGKCAICKTPIGLDEKSTHIDHCHSMNFVRGLLCFPCNVGLGAFKDNPEFLLSAMIYLGSPVGTSNSMEVRRIMHDLKKEKV